MRAGAYGLSLLSDPLDGRVVRALEPGPLPLIDLRRRLGSPPETTLRKHLKRLTELGLLSRVKGSGFPGAVSHELTLSGRDLTQTADALSAWLAAAPEGPVQLGTAQARNATKALIDGWDAKILRALAAKPLSLTELDRLLAEINYPALERRLSSMRLAGQIAPAPCRNGSTPYRVTGWLRAAVRPLASAAGWERRYAFEEPEPLGRIDVEALFLLSVPLLDLQPTLEGQCRLAVESSNGGGGTRAGIVVAMERGRPVSCLSDLSAAASSYAAGTPATWLNVLSGGPTTELEVGGDRELGDGVASGLREALMRLDCTGRRTASAPSCRA